MPRGKGANTSPCVKVHTDKTLFTAHTVDIEATTLTLLDNELRVNHAHPFEMFGTMQPTGLSFPQSDWPHFFFALYLSRDQKLDADDVRIAYELTACEVYTLSAAFQDGSTLTLELRDLCE